jgi:hypothetical protein
VATTYCSSVERLEVMPVMVSKTVVIVVVVSGGEPKG